MTSVTDASRGAVSRSATSGISDVALYIDPPSPHYLGDRLFHPDRIKGSHTLAPYAHLRDYFDSVGVPVHTADYLSEEAGNVKKLYISMGLLRNYRRLQQRADVILSAFFAMECPIVEPSLYRALNHAQRYFRRIFSWSDSPSLEPFVGGPLRCEPFRWPQVFDDVHEEIWSRSNRKFLVMINANKVPRIYREELYTERLRAVEYFGHRGEIDLYGVGWDGPPYQMGKTWVPTTVRRVHRMLQHQWQRIRPDPLLEAARRVYLGPVASKAETLGQYTFAICFENMVLKGWITEKIFDCFFAGAVPIYLGAPDIETCIPRECFIDMRLFASYQDLRSYLKSLGTNEIRQYKNNAREYLKSPQFRPFSKDAFVDLFRRMVEEDIGTALRPLTRGE